MTIVATEPASSGKDTHKLIEIVRIIVYCRYVCRLNRSTQKAPTFSTPQNPTSPPKARKNIFDLFLQSVLGSLEVAPQLSSCY